MTTLNVIGGGRVGKTFGLLFQRSGIMQVNGVVCRTQSSAIAAAQCIGGGRPIDDFSKLEPADVHLISVPDNELASSVRKLATTVDLTGAIVFHASGWLSSSDLAPAKGEGASVASVHPIKGFPDPVTAADSFPGTGCGIEGDPEALDVLRPAFEKLGAVLIDVDREHKALYHTATIIGCNYVVALVEMAQRTLEASGIDRRQSMDLLIPLLRTTADNLERMGTVAALTGPVARGDSLTISAHLDALSKWDPRVAHTYADLAAHLIDLAASQGTPTEALARISAALKTVE